MLLYLFTLAIILASFSGVIIITKQKERFLENNQKFFQNLALGIISVFLFQLTYELPHLVSLKKILFWFSVGFVLIIIIKKIIKLTQNNTPLNGISILVSDGFHNITDGILLFTAFSVSTELGFIVGLSIFTHEIIQEIGEFILLRKNFSRKRTLFLNFISSLTILIGVFIGSLFQKNISAQGIILSISAGGFFHVLIENIPTKKSIFRPPNIFGFTLGVFIMTTIHTLTPHTHIHENDEMTRDPKEGLETSPYKQKPRTLFHYHNHANNDDDCIEK